MTYRVIAIVLAFAATAAAQTLPANTVDQATIDAAEAKLAAKQSSEQPQGDAELRDQLARMSAENRRLAVRVRELETALALALQKLRATGVAPDPTVSIPQEQDQGDTIAAAIDEHRLELGMTLEQAEQALGVKGHLVGASAKGSEYTFTQSSHTRTARGTEVTQLTYYATFQGGKIIQHDQGDTEVSRPRGESPVNRAATP